LVSALAALGGRRKHALAWSVAVGAVVYLAFIIWAGGGKVLTALASVGLSGMCVLLALSLCNYSLRFVRWQGYLTALGCAVPWRASAIIYVAGFSLTASPGKAGELLRGVFLKHYGLSYGGSAAAFVSERLSDLVAVVVLALLGAGMYPAGGQGVIVFVLFGVVAGFIIILRGGWLSRYAQALSGRSGWRQRLGLWLTTLLRATESCHSTARLVSATCLSLVAWLAEACGFYLVLHWLGFDADIMFALSVYALGMLAGALSFLPGGIGGAEAVMVALLIWSGMAEPQAVAATVVVRMATLWFAVLLGVAALLLYDPGMSAIEEEPSHE
jgi:uncharacterized protein (TIRG00374 family)